MITLRIIFFRSKKRENKKGLAPIYCRLSIGGKRADFSTGIFLLVEQWKNEQCCNHSTANEHNLLFDTIRGYARGLFVTELGSLHRPDVLKRMLLLRLQGKEEISGMPLAELFSQWISEVSKGEARKYSTIKSFMVRFGSIAKYPNATNTNIAAIDKAWAERFCEWLKTETGYKANYQHKLVQLMRQLFYYAHRKSFVAENPFISVRVKRAYSPPVFLSTNELSGIMQHRFASERLQQVADLFIFQCHTGLAYCDLFRFSVADHIQDGFIEMPRQKTGEVALVPLLQPSINILAKYAHVLPVISLSKYNAYLKEVAEITGIKKRLTTHVGRKTCGNILLNLGMSIESVARILGHNDIRTTQAIYTKVGRSRIQFEMQTIFSCRQADIPWLKRA